MEQKKKKIQDIFQGIVWKLIVFKVIFLLGHSQMFLLIPISKSWYWEIISMGFYQRQIANTINKP